MGGSPCTHWSIAQKNNREVEPDGIGWELFKNYLIAKEKFKPDFFLYENNKSAAQDIKNQISKELNVPLQYINSALVSAQNRQRFYAHNWDCPQPEDRGIILRDILETYTDENGYRLSEPTAIRCRSRIDKQGKGYAKYEARSDKKSNTIDTNGKYGMVAEPVCIAQRGRMSNGKWEQQFEPRFDGKTNTITTVTKDNLIGEPIRIGTIENDAKNKEFDSKQYRVYSPDGKSTTICGQGGGVGAKTGLYACPIQIESEELSTQYYHGNKNTNSRNYIIDQYNNNFVDINGKEIVIYEVKNGLITIKDKTYPIKLADGYYIIRKLTPIECERLQTLPDNYTAGVSNTQRYKSLGNGWTAEVIIHQLKYGLMNIPKDEEIVVLSMYDGIGTGRYCLDQLGYKNVIYYAYEIDKYAKQIANKNYPNIIQCGDAFDLREDDWTLKRC
jgi:site-specific DNA-cytosine methylase